MITPGKLVEARRSSTRPSAASFRSWGQLPTRSEADDRWLMFGAAGPITANPTWWWTAQPPQASSHHEIRRAGELCRRAARNQGMVEPAEPALARSSVWGALFAPFRSAAGVVLVAMLLVAVPVTTALFRELAPIVVPFTLLSVVAFWLFAGRVRSAPGLVIYAAMGGALVGWVNCAVCVQAALWLEGDWGAMLVGAIMSIFVGFVGGFYGVAYGLAFAPLLLLSRRVARLRPVEGIDRSLLGAGLWGVAAVALSRPIAKAAALGHVGLRGESVYALTEAIQRNLWLAATLGCVAMLAVGAVRLVQRRRWLARVRAGEVPGWLVCPSERFDPTAIVALPEFTAPFWRGKVSSDEVLVEEQQRPGAYRSHSAVPRFRVA